jgi:hypothetical protein
LHVAGRMCLGLAYADFLNSVLVNTWNQSSFPAYKSRLWNKEEQAKNKGASSGRA